MAQVLNVPEDKRFASLGQGLGMFFAAQQKKKEEEEAAAVKKQAFLDALGVAKEISSTPGVPSPENVQRLGESLSAAGKGDELDNFVTMITNLKKQQSSQDVAKAFRGTLKKGSQAERSLVSGATVQDVGTITKSISNLRPTAEQSRKRDITIHKPDGTERQITIPATLDSKGIRAFIESEFPGFSREKPPEKDKPTRRQETETERNVNSVLINRGIDKPTPKDKAGARNLIQGRKSVNAELAARFGGTVIVDKLGQILTSFEGKEKERIQYSIAIGLADDILFAGTDQNDAINEAEEQAKVEFNTGTWIPPRVTKGGVESVAIFLDKRKVVAPQIVQYIHDLQIAKVPENPTTDQITAAKKAYRRAIGVLNPFATTAQIDSMVAKRFP